MDQPDVKPIIEAATAETSTHKRRRTHQHRPRHSKLRKLNADVYTSANPPHSQAPPRTDHHHAADGPRWWPPLPAASTVARLLTAAAVLCTIVGICVPDAIPERLLDALDDCRQQFETEFNAFVHDNDDRSAAAAADPFARTVRQLHEQVAHQNAALAAIERMLRNHSHAAAPARLSAAALIGGSGTGKTLSVGIAMREWLAGHGHVLHHVWSPTQPGQPYQLAAFSRYQRNLLVVDSIPPRHAADIRRWHSELMAGRMVWPDGRQRRIGAPVLAVYVFNVPTFGLTDVQRLDETVAALQRTLETAESDDAVIVPIVFEQLGRAGGQLRECIERERRRLGADELSEAQRLLIEEGIDVRQSGCKHVGARMAMYL